MRSRPRLREPVLSSAARCSCGALRRAISPMRWLSSSQRSTCSVLRRSEEPVVTLVALVARDVPVVVALLAPEGAVAVVAPERMVAVVVSEGTAALVALEGTVAVAAAGRMVVATLASPGMPAELSMVSLPFVPAALPVVGHPGSTGCGLDKLMEARACADEANTISPATLAIAILFIVRPRINDVPT
jgi:hypothetical protein